MGTLEYHIPIINARSRSMKFFKNHNLRKAAKATLHEARNVLNMNRDLFDADVVASFENKIVGLSKVNRHSSAEELETAIRATQELVETRTPKCASPQMRELVETLIVAFGVAMAFRAYFFQPFKIPTGSMQPTLYGIHSVTATDPDKGPGLLDRMPLKPFKWLVTGTWYRDVVAESDGSVSVYTDGMKAPGYVLLSVVGKKFKVPHDAYDRRDLKIPNPRPFGMADNPNSNQRNLASGYVKKGERLWAGYITSGDQVFVNRMAWNFFPPKRSDVIVFATSTPELFFSKQAAFKGQKSNSSETPISNLPLMLVDTPIQGLTAGQHYIKRLVGLPNETISVTHPYVYANGVKIEGLLGMDRVASMKESVPGGMKYAGYHCTGDEGLPPTGNAYLQKPEDTIKLGDEYLPMGDNTLNSWDGRYWGGVPRIQMLGPGALVYWPFSRRWGIIR